MIGTATSTASGAGPSVRSLRFDWAHAHIDGFTESITLGHLDIVAHELDSVRSTTGLQLAYDGRAGQMPLRPFVRAQWQHEFGDDRARFDASFDGIHSFEVIGPRMGRIVSGSRPASARKSVRG